MIKPTSSYKMSSQTKALIDRYKDPHIRGAIKRSWIQAELEASIKPRSDKNNNRQSNDQ
jgi:hypothetical protein